MGVDRYQYLMLLALCLVVTVPLELLLGVRVWRRPRRLAEAVVPAALIFSIWDVVAVKGHLWTYSARYTTGWTVAFGLPVEELAFFVVVPVCGVLTLEAVRVRLRRR